MIQISSLQNPTVRGWREWTASRGQRDLDGIFQADGEHMVQEAIRCGCVESLLVTESGAERYGAYISAAPHDRVYLVSERILTALSSTKTPQGIMAFCKRLPPRQTPAYPDLRVALNAVQDPGNVGTIIRTMDAAGFGTLYIDQGCADPYAPKTSRATMGGIFRVPIVASKCLADDLKALQRDGFKLIAGDLRGDDLFQRKPIGDRAVIMIGNEGQGLSEDLRALADTRIRIPMPGSAESLNAAVSAGILIYDLLRETLG